MRLQVEQVALNWWMSRVMPGQKIADSALAVIADVPWSAAWSDVRHACRRDGGMTMRSLYVTVYMKWDHFTQNKIFELLARGCSP